MQLELESLEHTKGFLSHKWASGAHWVGYPAIDQPLTKEHMLCFHSAMEASKWCQPSLTEPGAPPMQEIRHFKPVADLLVTIEMALQGQEPVTYPPEDIPGILQKCHVSPLYRHTYDSLCVQLATGELAVASLTRLLIPGQSIDQYHLVSHHHQVHRDFEVGHTAKIVESYKDLNTGHRRLWELAPQLTHDRAESVADLILVGQLGGSRLLLDIEGRPDLNTGITIATAYNYMGVLKVEANANPGLPQTMDQRLFVRLDAGKKQLVFFNDELQPADTTNLFQSVSHYWFYDHPAEIVSSRKVKQRYFYNGKGSSGAHISH